MRNRSRRRKRDARAANGAANRPQAARGEDTGDDGQAPHSNYFRFRLGPEVVIAAGARVKRNGEVMRGEDVVAVGVTVPDRLEP